MDGVILWLSVFTTLYSFTSAARLDKFEFRPKRGCQVSCKFPMLLDSRRCQCIGLFDRFRACTRLKCLFHSQFCSVYEKDSNGCPTCKCLCQKISSCPKNCRNGVKAFLDKNGCETCTCKPDVCQGLVNCKLFCPNGYVKNKDGCDECKCKPHVKKHCRKIRVRKCRRKCRNGFEIIKNDNGCKACLCKSNTCQSLKTCKLDCPNGYVKNKHECDICQCRPSDQTPCNTKCGHFCPNGFVSDKNGCQTCECKIPLFGPEILDLFQLF